MTSTTLHLDDAQRQVALDALEVLEANWLGHATQPGRLYPHQWSWDTACIAMGRAPWEQERAELEMRSLFAGQWSNGLLPHIVFTDAAAYFPGPDYWQTQRSAHAPTGVRTSGIVQPPIHATCAWRLYQRAPDRERATAFLADMLPALEAWHGYLYRERTRGSGLAEVWHPWESGMDNSPAWDEALARIVLSPDQVPDYHRVDVDLADASERPSDYEYDRYAYLVKLFRDLDYDDERIRAATPFALRAVLFNALLVQSNRDLAQIARVVDADPAPYEAWAALTAEAFEQLWDEHAGVYVDFDVCADSRVEPWTAAGFTPLYAGVPSPARAERMLERLTRTVMPVGEGLCLVPSIAREDPRFEPARYWRGPAWPIHQWIVEKGADRYGAQELAARIRLGAIECSRRGGFWEHYDPEDGHGQGIEQFAWSAGLILDLLGAPAGDAQTDGR